jgi:hypothetical protein
MDFPECVNILQALTVVGDQRDLCRRDHHLTEQ